MRIRDYDVAMSDTNCLCFLQVDEVYFRVRSCDSELWMWFYQEFKVRHPNWRALKKRKPSWNGYVHMMSNDGLFPIGLLERACKRMAECGYNYYVEAEAGWLHDGGVTPPRVAKLCQTILDEGGFELRDYQLDAMVTMMTCRRSTIECSVGGGKSLLIYLATRISIMQGRRVLIVVPTTGLVEQLHSDMIEYGWDDIGQYVDRVYSGLRYDEDSAVIITTWQSVVNKERDFFQGFGTLLVDEAHTAKSESLLSIARMCRNAEVRHGFTGTMPDDELSILNIEGYLGAVKYKLMAGDLIDMDVLSKFKIVAVRMCNGITPPNDYAAEISVAENLPKRNAVIVQAVVKRTTDTENVVVLCKHKDHMTEMVELLTAAVGDRRVVCRIDGDTPTAEREQIRLAMIAKGGHVLVASYQTTSAGVNIPRLEHVMFASPYRSKIKVVQSLGRGLRKHVDKAIATLWDFVDEFGGMKDSSFTWKHYRNRLNYYRENRFAITEISVDISARDVDIATVNKMVTS